MNENELEKKFNEADINDLLDRKTIAVGLGLKLSLLVTKGVKGGGPPYEMVNGRAMYKKLEAIEWAIQYNARTRHRFEYTANMSPEYIINR